MDRFVMTINGQSSLRDELRKLKSEDRPNIIKAIATAREFGDLKENAEYHAAKEKQSFIEGRIKDIDSKLSNAQVIDVTTLNVTDKVVFGSTVSLCNLDDNSEITYKIVGEDESNIESGLLSYKAPLAKAIMGKNINDLIEFNMMDTQKNFEIIKIEYV
ncbi:MAG: transcription elongation factor GreA [Gammaproteobacteria bacterium]|jgi:transcription elongation factor GreA|nr:transcription elongation factor GreA [Gammaproteobacteria bacterium]MBT5542307.1 transcription elongation factor GreA [Gammaproteobacteria bacterium]MBT7753147.1 transcription elongation factor GreA [Gammaproteobacteria bacterium]